MVISYLIDSRKLSHIKYEIVGKVSTPQYFGTYLILRVFPDAGLILHGLKYTRRKTNILLQSGVMKFTIILEDGNTWLVYVTELNNAAGASSGIDFTVLNNGLIQATSNFNGIIQIARSPGGDAEALYDAAAGAYPTSAALSGSASGNTGSYTLSFTKGGIADTTLLMFCLNHHLESFSPDTTSGIRTTVQLDTTTKGKATAVIGDSWSMNENLPTTMGFAPWNRTNVNANMLSAEAVTVLQNVALGEVSENMATQTNLNSMYYSGKVSYFRGF